MITFMTACANCGEDISAGFETVLRGKNKKAPPINVCSNCAYDIEKAFQAETEGANLFGAAALGLGAALIASLIWYGIVVITNYELGIIAIVVGFLVAKAVMIGAGNKRGVTLQLLSASITLFAMSLSEYMVVRHFLVEMLSEEGITGIPLLLPINIMVELVIEGILANPITLLFWAIALWQAWVLPASRRLQRV